MRWALASLVVAVCVVFIHQKCSTDALRQSRSTNEELQFDAPAELRAPGESLMQREIEAQSRQEGKDSGAMARDSAELPRARSETIDWTSVHEFFPIPREMPAGDTETALGAGFAPEWVEHSIGKRLPVRGQYSQSPGRTLLDPRPMMLDIMSQPKDPDDNWAYGLEEELRELVKKEYSGKRPPAVTRTFCNRLGCLLYLEFDGKPSTTMSFIPHRILKAPWREQFGITGDNLFLLHAGPPGVLNGKW